MNKTNPDHLYQADPHMLYLIMKVVLRLKRDCYLCDLVLLIYTSVMYSKFNEDLKQFSILVGAMIVFLGFVQYLLIVKKGNFINHIVVDVSVNNDEVAIQTAAFNGPWWFKKKSIIQTMLKTDLKMQPVLNPYPGIFKDNPKLLRLLHRGKDQYLVALPYFDHRMETDLQE